MKKTLIISVFVLLSSTFGCMSLDPSTVIIKSFRQGPFDAIFVPGCPYTKPEYEGLLLARVYWAKYIWEQGMTKRILFSGSSVYTPYVEAKIMREIAICAGIDSNVIRIETEAEHSSENLYYCYKMAQDSGWKNVALATDIFQMGLLSSYIDALEYDIKLIPMDWDQLGMIERYDMDIDATKAFVPNFIPITDTLTPQQIKINSSGARVFPDLNLKEKKEKIPKKSHHGKPKI